MAWAEEPVQEAVEAAMETLRAAGRKFTPSRCRLVFRRSNQCTSASWPRAPPKRIANNSRSTRQEYAPRIAELIREGLAIGPTRTTESRSHQRRFTADMAATFTSGDAAGKILVMPATVTPAPASLATTGDPRFNAPWTYAGLPVVTIPCGLSDEGLPIGLRLVSAHNGEEQLLAAAMWCERELGGSRKSKRAHQ